MGGVRRGGGRPRRPALRRPVCVGVRSRRRSAALLARMQRLLGQSRSRVRRDHRRPRAPRRRTSSPTPCSGLLGGRTQVRVWWRSDDRLAVRHAQPTGERRHPDAAAGSWRGTTRTTGSTVRARGRRDRPSGSPGTTDTLPPALAARLLSDATVGPAQRPAGPAGRRARGGGPGLRPSDSLSSVDRVDVWADAASGIPVTVEVFGRSGDLPAMSTTFLDFSHAAPTPADRPSRHRPGPGCGPWRGPTWCGTSPGSAVPARRRPCSASPGRGRGRLSPPSASTARGVTQLAVSAVSAQLAGSLRDQLRLAAGARAAAGRDGRGRRAAGAPADDVPRCGPRWLVAGTVTADGLTRAASELGTVAS